LAALEHFDCVVVGSGFGGSVTAQRMAGADKRMVVLERGKAYPPGSFPRLRKDEKWFADAGPGGESWPVSYADLD